MPDGGISKAMGSAATAATAAASAPVLPCRCRRHPRPTASRPHARLRLSGMASAWTARRGSARRRRARYTNAPSMLARPSVRTRRAEGQSQGRTRGEGGGCGSVGGGV
eukprot:364555-Chlamydomonas_euryale.AAC.16